MLPVPLAVLPAVSLAVTDTLIGPSPRLERSALPLTPTTLWLPSLKLTMALASTSRPVTV
ncbi:hypothetical protein D3C87_1832090 [compost metagenome]